MQLFLLPGAEGPANTQNKMILDVTLPPSRPLPDMLSLSPQGPLTQLSPAERESEPHWLLSISIQDLRVTENGEHSTNNINHWVLGDYLLAILTHEERT